jgi:hypothetical protein
VTTAPRGAAQLLGALCWQAAATATTTASPTSVAAASASPAAAAATATAVPANAAAAASATVKSPPSLFFFVRNLYRLGEHRDFVRRALTALDEPRLLRLGHALLSRHREMLAARRELVRTSRWRLVRRSRLAWRVRRARLALFALRCRTRGWAALADAAVIAVLVGGVAAMMMTWRAMWAFMRHSEDVEVLVARIKTTTELLETHGGDGAKLLDAMKARGEALPMPPPASPSK